MKSLAAIEIERYDWDSMPVMGDRSEQVPLNLFGLIAADSESAVEEFYWGLENVVVVQGQLFEAAPAVVSVLLASLVGELSPSARRMILELLFQLVSGESDEEAIERGNPELGAACREQARLGISVLYSELYGHFSVAARDILEVVEVDKGRLFHHVERRGKVKK
ncbi:hypothetical protein GCM10010174_85500 [Kutzneria viridogrisea]|uniref:Uncharacterized protein n=1 Tax=Kutzneria viridogrisea TaxID=47990 RepID=A0ABR6BA39_9PSEU|nr:hypothetical protein [Kutzneria albida]MBA8923714.1 hypothetical protein [Kutzneria viridogrisea]